MLPVVAQQTTDSALLDSSSQPKKNEVVDLLITDTDTFFIYELDEIVLKEFTSQQEKEEYLRLVQMIKRVMPYAKLAAFRLQMMEDNLNQLKSKRDRKKYIKQTEQAIKEEFVEQLKNLHVDEGKLLLKLIHRETGNTTYEILKKYRGNATTFYWGVVAETYNADIKVEYDPIKDYWIEFIIENLDLE